MSHRSDSNLLTAAGGWMVAALCLWSQSRSLAEENPPEGKKAPCQIRIEVQGKIPMLTKIPHLGSLFCIPEPACALNLQDQPSAEVSADADVLPGHFLTITRDGDRFCCEALELFTDPWSIWQAFNETGCPAQFTFTRPSCDAGRCPVQHEAEACVVANPSHACVAACSKESARCPVQHEAEVCVVANPAHACVAACSKESSRCPVTACVASRACEQVDERHALRSEVMLLEAALESQAEIMEARVEMFEELVELATENARLQQEVENLHRQAEMREELAELRSQNERLKVAVELAEHRHEETKRSMQVALENEQLKLRLAQLEERVQQQGRQPQTARGSGRLVK